MQSGENYILKKSNEARYISEQFKKWKILVF